MRTLNAGCGLDMWGTDRIDIHHTSATTLVCDMEKGLPYDDETFDQILSKQSFEHMADPGKFLKELHRVLKPKGTLILTTDNARYWRYFLRAKVYHGAVKDDQHFGIYWPYHLKNHLERAGFEITRQGFGSYDKSRPKKVDRLLLLVGLEPIALPRLVIEGRKA